MKFTSIMKSYEGQWIYTLVIEQADMLTLRLDGLEQQLVAECEGSASIADKLLGLETIARRIEEAAPTPTGEARG